MLQLRKPTSPMPAPRVPGPAGLDAKFR
jgi:hypothetical protein